MNLSVLAIIPARFASTRFPGKPLVEINGKPMVQRVYEQVKKCKFISEIIVATDDQRIFDCVINFGGKALMTSNLHESGTDRCGEVIDKIEKKYDVIINIQGDEPYIKPEQLSEVLFGFNDENTQISSLCKKIENQSDLENSNIVKVTKSNTHKALYFSRSAIPFVRNATFENWMENGIFYKHIGLYAFRTDILKKLVKLPIGILEKTESLEQLRWLEAGFAIHINESQYDSFGIDTPEDITSISEW